MKGWARLFDDKILPGGPDWNCEQQLAISRLNLWRTSILDNVTNNKRPLAQDTCISLTMERDSYGCFAGFGRHLISDFLHSINCHPATPPFSLVTRDEDFSNFTQSIIDFMSQWESKEFINRVCIRSVSWNPFAFRLESNKNYFANYVTCYRLSYATIRKDVFLENAEQGLYDHGHIIGELKSYTRACNINLQKQANLTKSMITLNVGLGSSSDSPRLSRFPCMISSRVKSASVIPPSVQHLLTRMGWSIMWYVHLLVVCFMLKGIILNQVPITGPKDVRCAGYKTTLGPANFAPFTSNQPDREGVREITPANRNRGRPPKVARMSSVGFLSIFLTTT